MADEWEETTVGDLVTRGILERPLDGNHGSIHPKGEDFVASGVPFIMASDLIGGGIDTVNCSFIALEQANSLRKGFAKRGDVLLSHKATLGRTALVGEIPGDFVMLTPQVTYYRPKDPQRLNNRYLKYYFDSESFQQVLQSWAGAGSTRAYIGITDQLRLPVVLPPLTQQKAIAHILGTLDDKIELNRRMNETLEAMARALFKSWFVDFDPVRAKAEGRDPGLPKEIADLFPGRFADSELGEIPEGWAMIPLSEVTTVITKGTTPTQEDVDAARDPDRRVAYVRVNAVDEAGEILTEKLATVPESVHLSVLRRSILRAGDVLYTIAGTIGRVSIVQGDLLPANTNQAVAILRPKRTMPPAFLAFTLRQEGFREELHSNIVHAVQANLSLGTLSKARAVAPPGDVISRVFEPIQDLAKRVDSARAQSRTLAALRDTLLPKLISGELRVKDAERLIGERSA
jgi:type I restriction enzyme, S subunit